MRSSSADEKKKRNNHEIVIISQDLNTVYTWNWFECSRAATCLVFCYNHASVVGNDENAETIVSQSTARGIQQTVIRTRLW